MRIIRLERALEMASGEQKYHRDLENHLGERFQEPGESSEEGEYAMATGIVGSPPYYRNKNVCLGP
jgi:hypothetical protein